MAPGRAALVMGRAPHAGCDLVAAACGARTARMPPCGLMGAAGLRAFRRRTGQQQPHDASPLSASPADAAPGAPASHLCAPSPLVPVPRPRRMEGLALGCQLDILLVYEVVLDDVMEVMFPVNALRNLALLQVRGVWCAAVRAAAAAAAARLAGSGAACGPACSGVAGAAGQRRQGAARSLPARPASGSTAAVHRHAA